MLPFTPNLIAPSNVVTQMWTEKPGDPVKHILNKSLYAKPGERFYYRDCDPQLISYAISKLTGKNIEDWAVERLFSPLGITDYYWDVCYKQIIHIVEPLHAPCIPVA